MATPDVQIIFGGDISGLESASVDARAQLDGLGASVEQVGQRTTASMHSAGAGTAFWTRELRALGDELSSGRYRQADGTFLNLAVHAVQAGGAWAAANPVLVALGAAATAAAAALGYLIYEAVQANEAMRSIELGAAVAGFGVTAEAASKLRDSIEQLGNVSASNAAEIANAFAPLGPVGEIVAQLVAPHLQDLADAMGKKIPEAADHLAKAFINTDTTGKELIDNSRVLTQAQKEQYAAFIASGDKIGQYGLLVLELNTRLKSFEDQQKLASAALKDSLPDLETAESGVMGLSGSMAGLTSATGAATEQIRAQDAALAQLRQQLQATANDAARASAGIAKATAEEIRAHDLTFKGPDVQRLAEDRTKEQGLAVNPNVSVDARKEAGLKVLEYDKQINAANYADFQASENLKVAAAGKNSAAVIAIREQEAAKARELFGAGSNQERAAIEAVARAKEQAANRGAAAGKSAARDELADAQQKIQGEIAAVKEASELKIQTYKDEMKLKTLSEKEGTAAVLAELAKQKAAVDALYASEIALAGQKRAKIDELTNQETAYNAKSALAVLEAQQQAAQKTEQAWKSVADQMASLLDSQVNSLLRGTESIKQAFANMAASAIEDLIKIGIKIAAEAAALEALSLATGGAVGGFGTGGFGGFLAGLLHFDKGTDFVQKTGPAILHKGEQVVTADQNPNNPANTLNSVAASNSFRMGNVNIHAQPGQSGADLGRDFIREVQRKGVFAGNSARWYVGV